MKNLILLLTIIVDMVVTSCGYNSSYSYEEMQTFWATGAADKTDVPITLTDENGKTINYPIIMLGEVGYYPAYSNNNLIRYYRVDQ